MKKIIMFLIALVFACTLAACGGNKTDSNKLFVLTYNNADPNMSGLWKTGFQKYDSDYGYEIDWVDAANDDQKALEALDSAVASGDYAAYLINVVDQTNAQSYLDKVKSTGKPCIFWNRETSTTVINSYDKAYYVGIRSAEGGEMQGEMAAAYLNKLGKAADRNNDGKIGYIVIRGEKGHADAEARTTESPKFMTNNLDKTLFAGGSEMIKLIDGTDTAGASWDPVTATTGVEAVLGGADADKVDVILSNNDGMALGVVASPVFGATSIPIFGVDALSDALTAVEKGTMEGTIKNDSVTQADVCLQLVYNILNGKDISNGMSDIKGAMPYEKATKAFRVNHLKVTKDNVADHK